MPDLTVRGPHGNPVFMEEISRRCDVGASRVVPVPDASANIFVALAATCQRGCCVIIETSCYVAAYETQDVPRAFFNLDDRVRVSIALPPDDLRDALQRNSRVIRERLAEDA